MTDAAANVLWSGALERVPNVGRGGRWRLGWLACRVADHPQVFTVLTVVIVHGAMFAVEDGVFVTITVDVVQQDRCRRGRPKAGRVPVSVEPAKSSAGTPRLEDSARRRRAPQPELPANNNGVVGLGPPRHVIAHGECLFGERGRAFVGVDHDASAKPNAVLVDAGVFGEAIAPVGPLQEHAWRVRRDRWLGRSRHGLGGLRALAADPSVVSVLTEGLAVGVGPDAEESSVVAVPKYVVVVEHGERRRGVVDVRAVPGDAESLEVGAVYTSDPDGS